jgi:hypothetical protein
VALAGGFVRLEPGTTKNSEGRAFPLIREVRALLERRQTITRHSAAAAEVGTKKLAPNGVAGRKCSRSV